MLPPAVPVTPAAVAAISARHGLSVRAARPMPSIGIINTVHALDDRFVLRVPRDHPGHIGQARREAAAIPAAVAAGVRTPELVVFDDSCELLPVPFLVTVQVAGRDVESLELDPAGLGAVWGEVGADLARLHGAGASSDPVLQVASGADQTGDPLALLDQRVADGWIARGEAVRLRAWLERLLPPPPAPLRLVHGDLQVANVLVDPDSGGYVALVDWGCAAVADPAIDFRVVPMAALDPLLAGYRRTDGHDPSVTDERVLWRKLQLDLWALPFGPQPGCSWGENATARLVDLFIHLVEEPASPWRSLVVG